MKSTLVFLILAYVAADRYQRHRNCGLPTFTSRLPKNAQEQILKIWENYEDGDDCDKEYRETKQVLLKKDQLEEFNKFYAAMQRRKEEFQRRVDQLTPDARAAHEKLVKLREERNKTTPRAMKYALYIPYEVPVFYVWKVHWLTDDTDLNL
uniref:SXP/RAL-2 family protein Ani s 5-like cation-binding domain-containing protein n=1 Tax=Angiostrongylus cantonensis TaxID=6313 RepID=A0A0K0DLP8_ANGCA